MKIDIIIFSPPFFNIRTFQDKEFLIRASEQLSMSMKKSNKAHYASPEAIRKQMNKFDNKLNPNNIGELKAYGN